MNVNWRMAFTCCFGISVRSALVLNLGDIHDQQCIRCIVRAICEMMSNGCDVVMKETVVVAFACSTKDMGYIRFRLQFVKLG